MIHTTGIYTLTEIIKELDICRETFHNMRDRGLRVFKINRRVFVSGVEILRFMEEQGDENAVGNQ